MTALLQSDSRRARVNALSLGLHAVTQAAKYYDGSSHYSHSPVAARHGASEVDNHPGDGAHGDTMTTQTHFTLVVWLLLLWDYCDDLLTDAILCDFGHRETIAALDDIEHELEQLGIDNARAAVDALQAMM